MNLKSWCDVMWCAFINILNWYLLNSSFSVAAIEGSHVNDVKEKREEEEEDEEEEEEDEEEEEEEKEEEEIPSSSTASEVGGEGESIAGDEVRQVIIK